MNNEKPITLPHNKKIAYIQANWHSDIVSQSRVAFTKHLSSHSDIQSSDIDTFDVPGSLEIPLLCQQLAQSGKYHILIAAGLIVDGGIYRHEFVATTVLDAMMQVQLATNIPILSVVLTPKEFDESKERTDYFYKHFSIKGEEAANACLQVIDNLRALET